MTDQEAYCMHCKKAVVPKDVHYQETSRRTKGSVLIYRGTCPTCGTKVCRFIRA